jgi:NAD(P)H-flavin reductase
MLPHPARIERIGVESADTLTYVLRLDAPVPALDAAAPGQFVMLSLLGVGEAAFTLSDLVAAGAEPGTVTITVRRIGSLTAALFTCERGARVGVRGPYGRGFPTDDLDRPTVYVGGGCGLVPLKAAIDFQIARAPGTPIAVVYGARTPGTRVLRAALAGWRRAPGVSVLEAVEVAAPAWEGHVGGVVDLVEDAARTIEAERAALCGPAGMLLAAAARLVRAGLAPHAVHVALERVMKCGVGLCGHCYVNHRLLCRDGPVLSLAELALLPDAFDGPFPSFENEGAAPSQ